LTAPRGLSQPPTSFIGSWCPGIHRAPLTTSPQHKTRCSRPLCSSQTTHDTHPHPPPTTHTTTPHTPTREQHCTRAGLMNQTTPPPRQHTPTCVPSEPNSAPIKPHPHTPTTTHSDQNTETQGRQRSTHEHNPAQHERPRTRPPPAHTHHPFPTTPPPPPHKQAAPGKHQGSWY